MTYSKLGFCEFKQFVSRSVFVELQLMKAQLNFPISCCNSKIRGLLDYFYFERNYDALKSRSPCFLLNKNITFNKNETESKMGNPTHRFRDGPCASARINIDN